MPSISVTTKAARIGPIPGAAHVIERRTFLEQTFQGFLVFIDTHGQFLQECQLLG
jgi:hypothetical protein